MSIESDAIRFRNEIAQWAKTEEEHILLEVRRTVAAIQEEVVRRTPMKTGRAASSWHIELGGPNFDVDPSIDDDDEGTWLNEEAALAWAQRDIQELSRLSMDEVYDVYVSNGVPYIVGLEEGSSKQAASGFMAEGTVHWAENFLSVVITGPVERG